MGQEEKMNSEQYRAITEIESLTALINTLFSSSL
jgi:hypothetical protein